MNARKLLISAAAAAIAACGGPDPVAPEANNFADADIDVLPPDESVATPSDDLANGAVDEPAEGAKVENEAP